MYLDSPPDAMIEEYDQRYKKRKKTDREWRGDVTDDFFNRMLPEIHEDKIKVRDLLIDGTREFGKTTMACAIAEQLVLRIEELGHSYNIITVRSFKQVFKQLNTAPYQIILIDDARKFNRRLSEESMNNFQEIRHIFEKLVSSGVIICIWMIQDSYRLEREVRDQMVAMAYKNLKMSNYYRRDLVETLGYEIGKKAISILGSWSEAKIDRDNYSVLDNAILVTESWVGIISITESDNSEWRPYKPITNEKGIVFPEPAPDEVCLIPSKEWRHLSGEYQFLEFDRFSNMPLIKYGLENWEEIYREKQWAEVQKVKQHHVEAFAMWIIDGISMPNIAAEFGLSSRQALGNDYKAGGWFSYVREELIGHLVEYLLTMDGEYYENYKIIAGQGKVDLLSPDKKKAIEIKVRQQHETPTFEMLSGQMIQYLEGDSHECELCMCILTKKKAMFKVYKIGKLDKTAKKNSKEGFV